MKRNRTAKIAFRKANKQNVETIHKCIHTGYNALPWNNADFREIKRTNPATINVLFNCSKRKLIKAELKRLKS